MYSLYTTQNNFVIKREDGKDGVLVIDRADTGSLDLKSNSDLNSLGVGGYCKVIYCIIGIVRIAGDTYLIVATQATNVATIGCSQVLKITETEFISFRTGMGHSSSSSNSSNGNSNGEGGPAYHQMQSLLSSGHFYFSADTRYDITHSLQVQPDTSLPIWERVDIRFFWNKFIQRDFITHQLTDWCVPVMEGYVESKAGGMVHGELLECFIISRRSRFRAGTRYNSRGVDDDGNVANFVETEQIVTVGKHIFSFVQIRGSVPVFWEQTSAQLAKFSDIKITKFAEIGKFATKVSNKIQICRTPQSTTPAFTKHFKDLIGRYGSPVCLNLLAVSKSGEKALVEAFEFQMKNMDPNGGVRYIYFDVNEHCKGGTKMDKLDALLHNMYEAKELSVYIKVRNTNGGWRIGEKRDGSKDTLLQQHVVRTNCKDCLDRTNLVQSRIAWKVLEYHMKQVGLLPPHQSLEELGDIRQAHMTLWANNGDDISIMYAGSGSLKSNLTRTGESSIKGWLDDGKKSVTRFYMNNFRDSGRQEGIDQLLGLHPAVKTASPAELAIQKAMASRISEYTTSASATIFIGTFNAGAQDPGYESLSEWLDTTLKGIEMADIYAIGIQEVCELTPGKILATDPERGMIWEREVKRYLPGYVLVQSHQLVGLLMCLFVKEELVDCVRDVQYEITKVGLRGMAGNKGGIAIHMVFHNSSLCFVTGHLAAGHSNVDERNSDYQEINDQTAFGRGRNVKIAHHHYSFWFGDFNYRIDLSDDEVRRCIAAQDLEYLLKYDQLNKHRLAGLVFQQYQEAPIIFNPTYKYDMHTQIYDTSPKNRVPAWTDRILWKQQDGTQTSLLFYDRAEITLSDHRPVSAYFRIEVKKTDKPKERIVRKQIISSKSYIVPNGADVKDIISWDDTPAAAAAGTKSSGVIASLLDFDFDPRATYTVSPPPSTAPQPQPPQRPLSSGPSPSTAKKLPPIPAGAKPARAPDLLSAPNSTNSANNSRSNSPIFDPFNNFSVPPQSQPPQLASNPFIQSMPNLPMPPMTPQPMQHTPPKPVPSMQIQQLVPTNSMPNLPMPPPQMQQPLHPMQQSFQPTQQPFQPMQTLQPMQQPFQPIQQPLQPMQQPMQMQTFSVQPTQQPPPNNGAMFDPMFSTQIPLPNARPSSTSSVPRLVPPPNSARPRQNSASSATAPLKDQFDPFG